MDLAAALRQLGVRHDTLSQTEKKQLDRAGYILLPNILSQAQIAAMSAAMEAVYAAEGTGQQDGPAESSYMQNKTAGLDLCLTHPRVLAAVCHVLEGQIKSFGIHGRPHPPDGEQQALHVDYNGPAPQSGRYQVCNSLWMLNDFTPQNGATRVIPGSHLNGQDPKDALADPAADHPEQRQLLGPAGTVAVFNSHTWHGTTANHSGNPRSSLTSFFCRRDDPHMVFSSALSPAATQRLTPAVRVLFADPEPWTP
ncbi:MAG: phytanoyl-CoA dioxygenase [Candidatus Latescibacteria bacterium]|nr:phytanoyl-CoA dioxygenase [Candidatus Latescibacterota bacterium]